MVCNFGVFEQKVASTLQEKLREQYATGSETWNVVMGKTFGLAVAFTPETYMYLRVSS